MKVFISGPITGKPGYNRHEFDKAEQLLSMLGHTVLSPAKLTPLNNPEAIQHEDYMSICFAMIAVCDAVYFLAGWGKSDGSRMEYDYARTHSKILMFAADTSPMELYLGPPELLDKGVINHEQHS